MAKGNMLLGYSRGSVGDVTFSRFNNKQVVRARNRNPKNPRSFAQQVQRMVMSTVASATVPLKSLIDHSWQGVQYGLNSLSEFRRRNMQYLRTVALRDIEQEQETSDFLIKGAKMLVPARFQISAGSLAFPNYSFELIGVNPVAAIQMSSDFEQAQTNGYEDLSYTDFLALFGVAPGDQVTVVLMSEPYNMNSVSTPDSSATNYPTRIDYARIVFRKQPLTEDSTTWATRSEANQIITFTANVVDTVRSTSVDAVFYVANQVSKLHGFTIGAVPMSTARAIAVIRSNENGGNWLRSNSFFAVGGEVQAPAQFVYPTYAQQVQSSISDVYLNQGLGVTSAAVADVQSSSSIISIVSGSNEYMYDYREFEIVDWSTENTVNTLRIEPSDPNTVHVYPASWIDATPTPLNVRIKLTLSKPAPTAPTVIGNNVTASASEFSAGVQTFTFRFTAAPSQPEVVFGNIAFQFHKTVSNPEPE